MIYHIDLPKNSSHSQRPRLLTSSEPRIAPTSCVHVHVLQVNKVRRDEEATHCVVHHVTHHVYCRYASAAPPSCGGACSCCMARVRDVNTCACTCACTCSRRTRLVGGGVRASLLSKRLGTCFGGTCFEV